MQQIRLERASDRETYSEIFQVIDAEDGTAIDLSAATIVCEMNESGCTTMTAFTVTIDTDSFTISLTSSQMRALNAPAEYEVGCTIEIDDFITQSFVGTLTIVEGHIS